MKKLLIIISLVITACAPTTQFPDVNKDLAEREAEIQRDIALKETHKHFTRLQNIAAPIFIANADICPHNKVRPFYGFHVDNVDVYTDKFRGAAERIHGLRSRPTIYYITADTPAVGTFQEGDVITQVNGKKIPTGKRGNKKLMTYIYDKDRLNETTSFVINRDGTPHTVAVTPVASCGGRAYLSEEPVVNAYADGESIFFTRQMMKMTQKDEELALVIGHEIAHNSRKHIESKKGNAMIGVVFGGAISVATGINVMNLGSNLGAAAFSQDFEAEADYVGLYHAARAGYDIDNAPYFWCRMAAENPAGIDAVGGSHPSDSHRFVALEATVKEINAKKAKGLPLIPEEKTVEALKADKGKLNE